MKTSTIIHRACLETLEHRRLLSFGPAANYTVGTQPTAVATADLNSDTRLDLVTANTAGNNVSVLLSNADGTFQAAQNFATGAGPRSVAVGHFDSDNNTNIDVVTANASDVSVLLGNGNGTLQPAQSIVLPGQLPPGYTGATSLSQRPVSVAVGDLNADNTMDLVVTGRTSFDVSVPGYYGYYIQTFTHEYVNVLLGDGSGGFAHTSATLNTENNPILGALVLGHFNDDTNLDAMTANASDVSVLLGNGDGTLQAPLRSGPGNGSTAAVGDINNDQKLDVLLSNVLLKGRGDGTFESTPIPSLGTIRSVALGDVNADGKLDLVANTSDFRYTTYGYYGGYDPVTTDYTKVLLGYGDGSFALPTSTILGSHPGFSSSPNAAALGDFDGDTKPDLAATEPSSAGVTVQLNEANWVLPAAVRIDDVTVTEGNDGTTNAVFTVTLTPGDEPNATVNYIAVDGSATLADGDYQATSGTLSFTAGQTSKTITVPVNGDRIGEADESFFLNLTGGPGVDVLDGQGFGLITDDEPRIDLDSVNIVEGDSSTKQMTFTATLSAASDQPVTVKYATFDGYAEAGKDYNAASGTLSFAPGQTSRTFAVEIKGDQAAEYTEEFYATLSDASNALIVNGTGIARIEDNDPDPQIVISNASRTEGNSATKSFDFIVSLSKPTEKEVYVEFETFNGTATSSGGNRDYHEEWDYLYFEPGETAQTITVRVIGDTRNESDETFFVDLTYAEEATIADERGVGTIQNDDGALPPPPAPSPGKVSIVTDPGNSSKTAVKIEGTDSADTITVNKSGSSQGKAVVKINGANKGTFSFSGSILVYGKNGNDNLTIDDAITRSAFIFGGDGKDTASGGGGADAIVGNAGNDNLKGNSGRDLLIGGDSADKLSGGGSDDILVAGRSSHENDAAKLSKLLNEWKRTDKSYNTRIGHIVNGGGLNGSVKLNSSSIFSQSASIDSLTGGSSNDLFFAAVPGDLLTDKAGAETVVDVG